MAGLMLFHGTVHVGTYCNDGSYTLPLNTKVNVESIESDGTNQITIISYFDTSLSSLIAKYTVFKLKHKEYVSTLFNPCHLCINIHTQCKDAFAVYNMHNEKNIQFVQSYGDNADQRYPCSYNIVTFRMQDTYLYLDKTSNNTRSLLPQLLLYKISISAIHGQCSDIKSHMKTRALVYYCSSPQVCSSLVLYCGDVLHSRSTHIKLAVHPGYDWHYVIIHAKRVAKAFPVCKSLVSDVHEPVFQLHDIHSHRSKNQCYAIPVTAKHITLHSICGTILIYLPGLYIVHWVTSDAVW